jgi:hypothetical protein
VTGATFDHRGGPSSSATGAIQLKDVFVDERTVDRHIGGLYILEMGF